MHSLRRRLEDPFWASKKALWGRLLFWRHIIKHGDGSEGTSVFLLRLLCSALPADGEVGFWRYIPSFLLSMNSVFIMGGIVCVYLCMSE